MPHQVKIYSGHPDHGGKLVKIIKGDELFYRNDGFTGGAYKAKNNGAAKRRPKTMVCEVCEATVSFVNHKRKVCRKVSCKAEWENIKEGRLKNLREGAFLA